MDNQPMLQTAVLASAGKVSCPKAKDSPQTETTLHLLGLRLHLRGPVSE